ncbi:unnamed protein product [Arabidopsis lyrata]|uniref:F-box domain-containing protein n=1 Tax=Arabidopsis lyrata subsp. lyrata TaxID=81972 RepID=D7L4T7_ARALL|nr:F-box/kelch-repeat protein At3g06240 [Arabidopsis lyrata subsp. lyrata]EFH58717.1 hypothetical protein ARALYDRAFT_896735 [Arabidopsis lyrata subsp. lyrata]CAH8259552.1 unnamed protein product [Arabidopsis lyrata]|eukprot:XP_002882458.1 F-box/kelch-repeat protein At3g06240 [Arabidopsis lyrata subsp. lyrata]
MEAANREKQRENDDGEERTNDEASPGLLFLPHEIITEILLRLPTKSIGQCRCVSKLLCSLSPSPGFVKSHLERSNHRKMIVSTYNLYSVDVDWIGDGCEGSRESVAAVELNYPLKDDPSMMDQIGRHSYRRSWVVIVGSSNGLVCLSLGASYKKVPVFLFNPTTGDSKRLPEAPVDTPVESFNFRSYGFGFDDHTHDYKVVKLVATSVSNQHILDASVYSLKANSWRRICILNYKGSNAFHTCGVHFNGAIHWVLTRHEDHRVILVFDLTTEEFREMPFPDEAEDCSHKRGEFMVGCLNGRLCVVNHCNGQHDDIWVMNEYGEAKSWSRMRMSLSYWVMRPQCSTKNDDEVLLDVDGDMVLYNFKTDASRRMSIRGFKVGVGFEADTYVESLIAPSSYGIASRARLLALNVCFL